LQHFALGSCLIDGAVCQERKPADIQQQSPCQESCLLIDSRALLCFQQGTRDCVLHMLQPCNSFTGFVVFWAACGGFCTKAFFELAGE